MFEYGVQEHDKQRALRTYNPDLKITFDRCILPLDVVVMSISYVTAMSGAIQRID